MIAIAFDIKDKVANIGECWHSGSLILIANELDYRSRPSLNLDKEVYKRFPCHQLCLICRDLPFNGYYFSICCDLWSFVLEHVPLSDKAIARMIEVCRPVRVASYLEFSNDCISSH